MAMAGRMGLELDLGAVPRSEGLDDPGVLLFAESASRLLVEVRLGHARDFEAALAGVAGLRFAAVGMVFPPGRGLRIAGPGGRAVVDLDQGRMLAAWRRPLAEG
jgi:phosphoribosylformylglycinamidine synthase